MITFDEPIIGEEEKELLLEAIGNSSVVQGPYVKKFEGIFSSYCNVKYASACINGTAALHLALASLGIKKGDEVIVPSFTFIATANAVTYTGAKPVFVDINKDTLCIDPDDIRKKITKKTKAIIPVHIFGYACDMETISNIARKNKLYVIEDAAEATGTIYKGKKAGSLSDIGCFSFYATKIIRTGEGGMCLTNNKVLDDKIKLLRAQGKAKNSELKGNDFVEKKYYHPLLGFNYRITDLQAAIGIVKMRKISTNLKLRKKIALIYDKEFKKYDIGTIQPLKNTKPVYWVYPLLFKDRKTKLKVGNKLKRKNIPFLSFFWPCHKQPFYNSRETLPATEDVSKRGLIIPCDPLITEKEAVNLAKIIGKAAKNA